MAEELKVSGAAKEERYRSLLAQAESLVAGESDAVANMANVCAALKYGLGFFWAGFYLVKGEELVLGPFQGPLACTRIKKGKGVCGRAWERGETVIVPDVSKFPGHIACSSLSKSEIVVPLKDAAGRVTGVLDLDSDSLSAFDAVDAEWLERLVKLLR